MRLEISVDSRKLIAALVKAPKETVMEIKQEHGKQIADVQRLARRRHRYRTRSGMLERSVLTSISPAGLRAESWIESGIAHYGKYIHEGFKSWVADRFLYNAFKERARNIAEGVSEAIARALKKAGLT